MSERRSGTRLLVGGLLIVLVPLIVVAVVAVLSAGDGITSLARSDLDHTATAVAIDLQGVMSEQLVTAGAMASSTSVVTAAGAVDSGAAGSRAAAGAAQQEIERVKRASGEAVDAVVLIGTDGVCFASTSDGVLVGKDLSQRAYFKTATQGEANVGEVIDSLVTGRRVVIAASPIYDSTGTRVTGVLSLGMDREQTLGALAGVRPAASGYTFVVDASGLFLQHPVKANVLKVKVADVPGMGSVAQVVTAKRDATVTYTLGGEKYLAAVRRVPVTGWSVAATAPESELYASATHTRTLIVGVTVVAGALAALAFSLLARSLRRRQAAEEARG